MNKELEEKPEEEKVEEKPKVETPEEAKPEDEEKETDEAVDAVAEKVLKIINSKLEESAKSKEVKEKKEAIFVDEDNIQHKTNKEYDVDFYTKKDGEVVKINAGVADELGNWFKNFVSWKSTGSPDTFQEMKKNFTACEKFAQVSKLEPLNTTTATDGGNLVPTILFNEIIPLLEDMAVIRPNARVINMKGIKTLALPSISSKPYVSWNAEAAQKSTTSVQFGQISLTPYILAGIIPVTTQLIDDSPFNVIQLISELLAEAIAKEEDRAFMNGTGTGQPTGITTYTPGYTAGVAGTLAFTDINSCYMGLPQKHRASAKLAWIMHSNTLATLLNMQDGNNRPIVDINAPFSGKGLPTIRGAKVLEQNDCSQDEIWLVDLNYYWIGYSRTMGIDIAKEATIGGNMNADKSSYIAGQNMWERNMIAIRAEEKVDGELVSTRAAASITGIRD